MSDFFSLKHSFNAGDCIVLLPGLKKIYEETGKKTRFYQRLNLPAFYFDGAIHPITNGGIPVCMNEDIFNRINPLIEAQEYIESFVVWEGQKVDWDIDLTRDSKWIPMPAGLIHQWAWALYPEMNCDISYEWIDSNFWDWSRRYDYKDSIIINRTERYTNPYISYFFLKDHQDHVIFSGTKREHEIFCEQFGLTIPLLITEDFLELSKVIASCKLFIGNQSLHFHLADSQKVPRILELCPQFPNTFCTGASGSQFYHQRNLEYYFKKATNE